MTQAIGKQSKKLPFETKRHSLLDHGVDNGVSYKHPIGLVQYKNLKA